MELLAVKVHYLPADRKWKMLCGCGKRRKDQRPGSAVDADDYYRPTGSNPVDRQSVAAGSDEQKTDFPVVGAIAPQSSPATAPESSPAIAPQSSPSSISFAEASTLTDPDASLGDIWIRVGTDVSGTTISSSAGEDLTKNETITLRNGSTPRVRVTQVRRGDCAEIPSAMIIARLDGSIVGCRFLIRDITGL